MKYLYFVLLIIASLFLLITGNYPYMTTLLVSLGVYIIILEAFEKDIKLLRLKGKGVEVAIEMSEAKEKIKEKAASLTQAIEQKGQKEMNQEKVQELIQKNLDEAFAWGLKIAGYKPFNEVKDVKILKDNDGNDGVTWSEN